MIVSGDSGSLQFTRFGRADLTQGDAHFHPKLAHLAHDLENALKFCRAVANATPRRAHAEPGRALCSGPFCRGSYRLDRQQLLALDAGGIVRRLRAIGAIFAAAAGLDAEQTATLHRLAGPMLEMHSPALRN